MASSGTGCDPVVIESDENNSSQNELDSENNFKCCQGKKTYKAEDVLRLKKEKNVCVPATSVESERTFSSLGLLLTKRENCA